MLIEASDKGLSGGIGIGTNSLKVHHLLFAEDTILFSSMGPAAIDNLFGLVNLFEPAFGLNINHHKPEILG